MVLRIMANPFVSVVLPTYEGAFYLKETLLALANQEFQAGFEVVAIDSNSSDETPRLLREAGARLFSIPQPQFGHGKTRNFGVGQARGQIIVFLSQDALPVGRYWLRTLVETLENPRIGATYARQLPRPDATPLETFFHQTIYPARASVTRGGPGRIPLDRLFFSNVCSAARRDVCLRFPFDETLIMSEDQLFSRDLLRAGLDIVYQPAARVVHSHHYNLKTLWKRNFDSGYSMRGVPGESIAQGVGRATLFLSREVRFLARQKEFAWLLYLPLYEAVRFLALLSGTQAERLPPKLRIACSLHNSYWKQKLQSD